MIKKDKNKQSIDLRSDISKNNETRLVCIKQKKAGIIKNKKKCLTDEINHILKYKQDCLTNEIVRNILVSSGYVVACLHTKYLKGDIFDIRHQMLIFSISIFMWYVVGYLSINPILKCPSLRKIMLIILIINGLINLCDFLLLNDNSSTRFNGAILICILLCILIFILRYPVHKYKFNQIEKLYFNYHEYMRVIIGLLTSSLTVNCLSVIIK